MLALFDPNLDTIISSDASLFGLGAVLLQTQRDGLCRPVTYNSHAMSSTKQRYIKRRPSPSPGPVNTFQIISLEQFFIMKQIINLSYIC